MAADEPLHFLWVGIDDWGFDMQEPESWRGKTYPCEMPVTVQSVPPFGPVGLRTYAEVRVWFGAGDYMMPLTGPFFPEHYKRKTHLTATIRDKAVILEEYHASRGRGTGR